MIGESKIRRGDHATSDPSTIALIGAGNIGSRHLQGLAGGASPIEVYVVEKDPVAAGLSRDRLNEALLRTGKKNMTCHWLDTIDGLPDGLDVAIVATGSMPRREIIEILVKRAAVRFLILEKFLFPRPEDYPQIQALLADRGITAYVNTPRRCWPAYRRLLDRIPANSPVRLDVGISSRNGLATNAIHMIDLLGFISRDSVSFEFGGDRLLPSQKGSRHHGMVEFEGTLTGGSSRGDVFSMSAVPSDEAEDFIHIEVGGRVFKIDEAAQKMSIADGDAIDTTDFPIVYQSQLTGTVVDGLLENGACDLPAYAVSAQYHLECIEAFMNAEAFLTGKRQSLCRVT